MKMGVKHRSCLIVLLVAALVAACVSLDPRGNYDRRYDTLRNQQPSPAREAGLLKLAGEANAKAKSAKEAQDKVSYYARAATYAWAAGTEKALSQVILTATDGNQVCQTFPANQFKPARDCALLAAYGPVAAGQAALDRIETLKPPSPTTTVVSVDSMVAIDAQSDRFQGIVIQQWPTVDNAMTVGDVPTETVDWFGESKRRQWCSFYVMTNQAKRWKLDPANQSDARQTRASLAKHVDAVFAAGNKLVGTSNRSAALNACAAPLTQPPAVPAVASQ